jgi:FixJ family two-component response regulator
VTCVIADVRLPGMDGTELQRRIRRERRQLPVILITAHDDEDVRQQALRDGAVAFLVKRSMAATCWNTSLVRRTTPDGVGWRTAWLVH